MASIVTQDQTHEATFFDFNHIQHVKAGLNRVLMEGVVILSPKFQSQSLIVPKILLCRWVEN